MEVCGFLPFSCVSGKSEGSRLISVRGLWVHTGIVCSSVIRPSKHNLNMPKIWSMELCWEYKRKKMSLTWARDQKAGISRPFLGGSLNSSFLSLGSLKLKVTFGSSKVFFYQLVLWHWNFQTPSRFHWAVTKRFSGGADQSLLKPTAESMMADNKRASALMSIYFFSSRFKF